MEAPLPLYRYDDIYDAAADAVGCIDARLHRRGLQLEPSASEALRHSLESILHLMQVEFLDNEGSPIDPNEQHRPEVE